MAWQNFADMGLLRRYDINANDVPGKVLVVVNKGADQATVVNPDNIDGTEHLEVYLYNASGGACVAGQPYIVGYGGAPATAPKVIAPLAVASVPRRIVFAVAATANNAFGWFKCGGWCDGILTDGSGSSIAIGDFLKCAPGTSTVALLKDAATQGVSSCAIAGAVSTLAATAIRAYLIGDPIVVNT